MTKAGALLLVVVVTHYGYPFVGIGADDPEKWASWAFYIARGVEGTFLFWVLSTLEYGRLWAIVCWLGMLEESQTAVCGVLAAPDVHVPLWSGLCLEQFGSLSYAVVALAAITIAVLGTQRDRKT